MRRLIWSGLLLLSLGLVAALPAGLAQAAPAYDRIIQPDERVTEGVTVVGDDLHIEAGSVVEGAVTVVDGDVEVAGRVDGDLVVIGGDVIVAPTGDLRGACFVLGGEATDAAGCTVAESTAQLRNLVPNWNLIATAWPGATSVNPGVWQVGQALFNALGLGLLALFIGALAPRQLAQVGTAARHKPWLSGMLGFLTGLAGPSLLLLLTILSSLLILVFCLGLLGFPFILALGALLVAGTAFGWVAVGYVLGDWLGQALRLTPRSLALTAALGTAALTLGVNLLPLLPLGEAAAVLANLLALAVGLGAVVLTRFGTRAYPAYLPRPGKVEQVIEASLPPKEML